MIPLNFGLFWSGGNLSYLRYLTFKTLRHFHPDSRIQLFIAKTCKKSGYKWNREKQDFEHNKIRESYLPALDDLDVEVIRADLFPQFAPNFQSDLFRYWYLHREPGFYLDTDQIILRSFKDLPLDNEFIYSLYHNPQCGMYTPVGVIGAEKDSKIVSYVMKIITKHYNPFIYNSIGPFMLVKVLKEVDLSDAFNAPKEYFYPAWHSDLVGHIYNGSLKLSENNFCVHWFGGHFLSQEFNIKYTEDFAKTSNDSISVFLRENDLL